MYDIIIAGGGPAGVSAGIYAVRAGFSVLLLERLYVGSQIAVTPYIENYPGLETLSGADFAMQLLSQAEKIGLEIEYGEIAEFDLNGETKRIITTEKTYSAKAVILALGARPRSLGLEGEFSYIGRGLTYCASCDGSIYKDKVTAVVGGGNTALEDALYLSKICPTVYLIHRRDEFRGEKVLQDRVFAQPNIEIIYNSTVNGILGEKQVSGLEILDKTTNTTKDIDVSALFIAIGRDPETTLLKGKVDMDSDGYINTDDGMHTSIQGVFAAGDIRNKRLRQVVTAASDGALAATMAAEYLNSKK